MEIVYLIGALLLLLVEYLAHRYLAGALLPLAFFPGPERRVPLPAPTPAEGTEATPRDLATLPWPASVATPRAEFHRPSAGRPAYARLRVGADPTLARIDPQAAEDGVVLRTRLLPAFLLSPFLFAGWPLFVVVAFGPPTWPGVVCTVALTLAWLLMQRSILVGQVRPTLERVLEGVGAQLAAASTTGRAEDGTGAAGRAKGSAAKGRSSRKRRRRR